MEIILQDAGHVSLHLVGTYIPLGADFYDSSVRLIKVEQRMELDTVSFRPPGFGHDRWHPRGVPQTRTYRDIPNVQVIKKSGPVKDIRALWGTGRSMAAYIGEYLPQKCPSEGANIRTDFNCCSGVIGCLHAMGLSLEGLKGDAGTQYDFSQIGLDF